jgi:two-component system phosphate regulon sensor histidine kinase PhoR
MTHEFKTPISTIAVSAEVLKDPNIIHQPERLLNYATIIEKENTRLKHQVDRVLQMVRLDKEDIGLKKEMVDLHQVIEDAIRNTSGALHERNGSISCALSATKPLLMADKLHLTNVVYNLIDNAIKYCKQSPHIVIRTKDVDQNLLLEIEDNGIGISPENQKRVFQKFFRVPTGNVHDVKGFGIGLNYVKSIIEAHKGSIRLESDLGKGCIFKISLPFQ